MQNGLAYILSRNGRFGLEPNSKDRRSDLDIEVLSVYLCATDTAACYSSMKLVLSLVTLELPFSFSVSAVFLWVVEGRLGALTKRRPQLQRQPDQRPPRRTPISRFMTRRFDQLIMYVVKLKKILHPSIQVSRKKSKRK